jgi:hypothetical protein
VLLQAEARAADAVINAASSDHRGAVECCLCLSYSGNWPRRIQMRSRKLATARHCRRVPACVYPAIRDGWPAGARKQIGLAGVLTRRHRQRRPHSSSSSRFGCVVASPDPSIRQRRVGTLTRSAPCLICALG